MNEAVAPDAARPQAAPLSGRVILVTGASSGIGRALALAAAAQGAQVVLCGRTVRKLEAVHDAIVAAGSPRPTLAPLDFERAGAAEYTALAEALQSSYGRLDGLAHVAGQVGERAPVEHYDVPTWMRVMHVNLNAAFVLTRTLLPLLRQSSDASIVFTVSSVSQRGRAYWGAYAVAKFGVEGLMQVLADETSTTTNIRVNSVNPGPARTPMRAQAYPGEDPATVPAPEDVLSPYLYLLGPESRGVTGRRFDAQHGAA
jgi:NAD(P)-dependent dehydrogenase (short-subunit alcohol dehydrogenase family)